MMRTDNPTRYLKGFGMFTMLQTAEHSISDEQTGIIGWSTDRMQREDVVNLFRRN